MNSRRICIGAFLVAAALATAELAAREPIVLREQLKRNYGPQFVSFPFTAMEGECEAHSVQVAGAFGPVAAQLSDIEFWPGQKGYVKSARLSFVVSELQPLTNGTYEVTVGRSEAPAVATDLRITQSNDQVEITTASLGVRLLMGKGRAATGMQLAAAPSPLRGMRLGTAAWGGASRFEGQAPVAHWSSELLDAGPVFARVATTYTFADGDTFIVTATVITGDNAVRWQTASSKDRPESSLELRLPPVPGAEDAILPKGYGQWAYQDRSVKLQPEGNTFLFQSRAQGEPGNRLVRITHPDGRTFAFLAPNTSIIAMMPDYPPTIHLKGAGQSELFLASRDPGAWVDPAAPFTYGGAKNFGDPGYLKASSMQSKSIKTRYDADASVVQTLNLGLGRRKWLVAGGIPDVGDELERAKDMVLDWPDDPMRKHPHLFLNQKEIDAAWARISADPKLPKPPLEASLLHQPPELRKEADKSRVLLTAMKSLEALGEGDLFRNGLVPVNHYDALVDSGLLTPEQRKRFRAQVAYLGYVLSDPLCWSLERRYISGNPNMSCHYTMNLGTLACVIPEHPMAKIWSDYATGWVETWLREEVAPDGQWLPEGTHYSETSISAILTYAIAAQRAGFKDFSSDSRLKKLISYKARTFTPRDCRLGDLRGTMCFGRGSPGERTALVGAAARFYAASDPELSSQLQWLWAETGYKSDFGHSSMGSFDTLYLDRSLPARQPQWSSQLFAQLGAVLRSQFATPNENMVTALTHVSTARNLDVWSPEVGGISTWFGRGKPLSGNWPLGYEDRHELLRNGVRLQRNWGRDGDPKLPFGHFVNTKGREFAALDGTDYVRADFTNTGRDDRDWFPAPVNGKEIVPAFPRVTPAKTGALDWTRQVLFLKDADPAGPAYLVVRDTTGGGEPTVWQFWTLSEKIGTPEQARDGIAFLADTPGTQILPARELPHGDRYTALGQFGVDVEYFIASPSDTARHTLRFGEKSQFQGQQYQDLMHLQLPRDGVYYVALFPRLRDEAVPIFSKLADGKIIKTTGPFGVDFAFLAPKDTTAAAEDVSFRGTAGTIQQRPGSTTLSLAAAGELRWTTHALAAATPASLQVSPTQLSISLPADSPGGQLTVTAPGSWTLKHQSAGVALKKDDTVWRLTVPPGVTQVILVDSNH